MGLTYHEVEMNLFISGCRYLGVDRASCGLPRGHLKSSLFVSLAGLLFRWDVVSSHELYHMVSMLALWISSSPCVSCIEINDNLIKSCHLAILPRDVMSLPDPELDLNETVM